MTRFHEGLGTVRRVTGVNCWSGSSSNSLTAVARSSRLDPNATVPPWLPIAVDPRSERCWRARRRERAPPSRCDPVSVRGEP